MNDFFLRKYLLIQSKRNLHSWSPSLKKLMELFTLNLRLFTAVIREIIKNIPGQPSVKKVTVDFERAIWSAFQKVLPEVRIMGCAFHWTQALWRKVSVGKVLLFKTKN